MGEQQGRSGGLGVRGSTGRSLCCGFCGRGQGQARQGERVEAWLLGMIPAGPGCRGYL